MALNVLADRVLEVGVEGSSDPLELVGHEVSFNRTCSRIFEGKLKPGQRCKIILRAEG
jgi:hypothetical protein